MIKNVTAGALALVLAACTARAPRSVAPGPGPAVPKCFDDPPPSAQPGPPGARYVIEEDRSELRILVYRAGPMARFGHNHVLVNRALCGAVRLSGVPGGSAFWLKVPVGRFLVDDARARSEEGADFAAEVPDEAKSGTLEHMLGTSLLDAGQYPAITVQGADRTDAAPGTAPGAAAPGDAARIAKLAVKVAGHESTIDVPFTLRADSSGLAATGTVELRQTALGLTPYSLMLGALQVQDAITIKFTISARRAEAPP